MIFVFRGESFGLEFNQSESKILQNLFSNETEPIQNIFESKSVINQSDTKFSIRIIPALD